MSWDRNEEPHDDDSAAREQEAVQPEVPEPPAARPAPFKPKPKEKKSVFRGCLVAVLALIGVAGLLLVSFMLLFMASTLHLLSGGAAPGQHVVNNMTIAEMPVSGPSDAPKVAVVPVRGLLVRDDALDPVAQLEAMFSIAESDPLVKAVVLEVDSGGGSVYASDLMRKALLDFRERSGKPVVVLMGGVAASGAYYISCAADHVFAQPTTLTGSIGVLLPLYDVTGLMEHVGINDQSVTSGDRKTMLSPTRERTPDQMGRLQEIVDQMHGRFVDVVFEGRSDLNRNLVERLANGDVYTADEAVENGLVDAIGYLDDAVPEAAKLAKLGASEPVQVVRYRRYFSVLDLIVAKVDGPGVTVELSDEMAARLAHEPLYLWSPGSER